MTPTTQYLTSVEDTDMQLRVNLIGVLSSLLVSHFQYGDETNILMESDGKFLKTSKKNPEKCQKTPEIFGEFR
jgi:hypothetical protein